MDNQQEVPQLASEPAEVIKTPFPVSTVLISTLIFLLLLVSGIGYAVLHKPTKSLAPVVSQTVTPSSVPGQAGANATPDSTVSLASCSSTTLFSALPVAASHIYEISPLGNINPMVTSSLPITPVLALPMRQDGQLLIPLRLILPIS